MPFHLIWWCVVIWGAAVFASRWLGIWLCVGSVALTLGTFALIRYGKALRTLFPTDRRALAAGLASGALMIAATYLLYEPACRLYPPLVEHTTRLYGLFNNTPLWAKSVVLPFIILGEELVWRGLVQEGISQRYSGAAAAVIAAAIYSITHIGMGEPVLLLLTLACGCYWGLLRHYTRGLTAPLISHLLWDACVLLLFPLVRF